MSCIHCRMRDRVYGLYCRPCYVEALNLMAAAPRRPHKAMPGGTVHKLKRCERWYGDDKLGILPAVHE